MQSSKGIWSKGRGPLAGLAISVALTLGIALVPGAAGPAFGDTVPDNGNGNGNDNDQGENDNDQGGGGGGAGGGINISTSVPPGQTAVASSPGQTLTILAAGEAVSGGGAASSGTAVYPGICTISVTAPVDVDVAASLAAGANAFNVLIQPGSALGPGQNVLSVVTCHVTPPVSGVPPMAWYVTSGGTQVMIDPANITATANPDGSWEVQYSPVNVNDFANGGAVLHFQ